MLGNGDVRISYVVAGETSPFYRNAIGDECVYVESGTAVVETMFGALEVAQGDYVILPRATTHRWIPTGDDPLRLYAIEANSHITPPRALPVEVRPAARARALLRARPAWTSEPLLAEATTSRSTSSTVAQDRAASSAR